MLNQLLLLSKNDIPFPKASITIHQPTIKEIGYIGEEAFFSGIQFLNFSKEDLSEEEQVGLEKYTDFDILIQFANSKDLSTRQSFLQAKMVLALIFPDHNIICAKNEIVLKKGEEKENHIINNGNFKELVEIIKEMFSLSSIFGKGAPNYDPYGVAAKKLADKFKKYRQKIAKIKNEESGGGQKISILSRYISILTVGEGRDMNSFMNYTVYQLFEEFQRFNLKQQYDMYIQAKMAGAKDLKEMDNWMKDIHETN